MQNKQIRKKLGISRFMKLMTIFLLWTFVIWMLVEAGAPCRRNCEPREPITNVWVTPPSLPSTVWWNIATNPDIVWQDAADAAWNMLTTSCEDVWNRPKALNWQDREFWSKDVVTHAEWQSACDAAKKMFTCNTWTFMDWTATADITLYSHTECIVQDPVWCDANSTYTYNGHPYNIPAMIHWENKTLTSDDSVEDSWTYTYSMTLECKYWELVNQVESDPTLVACATNYTINTAAQTCEANTQQGTCWGTLPGNATAIAWDKFDQVWSWADNDWSPSSMSWTQWAEICWFNCDTNYTWNWSQCEADSQTIACTWTIPDNSIAITATSYEQTWNWTSWDPSDLSWTEWATDCWFSCNENFDWNATNSACEPSTRQTACEWTLDTNATATNWTEFTQTWDQATTSWLPATWTWWETNDICDFDCNLNFTWNWTICEADTQTVTCGWEVARWATATTWTWYVQTWDWSAWAPASMDWTENATECDFDCNTNYTWDWTICDPNTQACTIDNGTWEQLWNVTDWWACEVVSCDLNYSEGNRNCVPDTKLYTCWEKPEYTLWNSVWEYTQTWDWAQSAWLPAETTSTFNETVSSESCNFICDNKHDWNATTSTCEPKTESCELTNWTWERTRDDSTLAWWACWVVSCETWYHTEDQETCISDTSELCYTANGVWVKTWDWSAWWECVVYRCDDWFYTENVDTCKNWLLESGCWLTTTLWTMEACNYNSYLKATYYYDNDQTTAIQDWLGWLYTSINMSDACPDGFDVPSKDEWEQLVSGSTNWTQSSLITDMNILTSWTYDTATNAYSSTYTNYQSRTEDGSSSKNYYWKISSTSNYSYGFWLNDTTELWGSVRCIKRKDSWRCLIDNGEWFQQWDVLSWSRWECKVDTCWVDYYNPWDNTCTKVWVWYYSIDKSVDQIACTNWPANSTYISSGRWKDNCVWVCNDWYYTPDWVTCEATTQKALMESWCDTTIAIWDINICARNSYYNAELFYDNDIASAIQKWYGWIYYWYQYASRPYDVHKLKACPDWFDLPTQEDWQEMVDNSAYGDLDSLISDANLTYAGYSRYNSSNVDYDFYNTYSYYFTSATDSKSLRLREWNNDSVLFYNKTYSSVRCIERRTSRSCSVSWWSWTQTWNDSTNSWNSCVPNKCNLDYYHISWQSFCSSVWHWYYSLDWDLERIACTNWPANSTYVSDGNWQNNCLWKCNDWYATTDWATCVATTDKEIIESWCESTISIWTYEICSKNSHLAAKYYSGDMATSITSWNGGLYYKSDIYTACPSWYTPPSKFEYEDMIAASSDWTSSGFKSDIGLTKYVYTRTYDLEYTYRNYYLSSTLNYSSSGSQHVRCMKRVNTAKCAILNWFWTQTWDWSVRWTCLVETCDAGYYDNWNGTCSLVETWFYSPSTSKDKTACTNKPANSTYVSQGWWEDNCTWSCNTGYYTLDWQTCISN